MIAQLRRVVLAAVALAAGVGVAMSIPQAPSLEAASGHGRAVSVSDGPVEPEPAFVAATPADQSPEPVRATPQRPRRAHRKVASASPLPPLPSPTQGAATASPRVVAAVPPAEPAVRNAALVPPAS